MTATLYAHIKCGRYDARTATSSGPSATSVTPMSIVNQIVHGLRQRDLS